MTKYEEFKKHVKEGRIKEVERLLPEVDPKYHEDALKEVCANSDYRDSLIKGITFDLKKSLKVIKESL